MLAKIKKIQIKNNYCKVFLICLFLGILIFLPFIIYDNGYFLYYGDFNVQQIPFYQTAHDAVKSGNIGWNWNTDLGSNFISSYSFYLLMSPFFWITLLFPNAAVPFLMAPLLILKFACAGVTSFAFFKRFVKNQQFAIIGAICYAFCGFNVYNIFFNHFHESVIIFPLMLVAMEEFVINNRRGWFALTVCASALINYFFFFGQVIFLIIYFIVRCFCPDFNITLKKFLLLAFEAVLGFLMSAFILLPSIVSIISNPRTSNFSSGMDLLLYNSSQRYANIIQSLFFPPDNPSRSNFFPDSNSKWASLSGYIPLFSLVGVVSFVKAFKKHWLNKLLFICLIMALVPILNSSFYAFNSSYYARWFYMPVIMMVLATVLALENKDVSFAPGIKLTFIAVFIFSLIGVIPTSEDGELSFFSLPPFPERLWIYVAIAILSLLFILVLMFYRKNQAKFIKLATLFTCFIVVIYSFTIIAIGKTHSNTYEVLVEQSIKGKENITLDDSQFYRIDEFQAIDNIAMFWKMPSIQAFHSVVSTSIMDYYISIGEKRDVSSHPDIKYIGVRALTSVKYLFCDVDEAFQPYIIGFEFYNVQNGFNVYENKYFIPMGFTYDHYISQDDFNSLSDESRDKALIKAILISDEDIASNSDILADYKTIENIALTEDAYLNDCLSRAEFSGYYFEYDNEGFVSKIELPSDDLVFYSVPYEEGWSAYVNDEPAQIIKANTGFMAVRVPAGDNTITFKYKTPKLATGIKISVTCLIVFLIYLAIIRFLRKKHPSIYGVKKYAHLNEIEDSSIIRNHNSYIKSTLIRIKKKSKK